MPKTAIVMRTLIWKCIWVAALMVGLSNEVLAQADVDSPYSLFGVGQVRNKSMNVRLNGMGHVRHRDD